MKPTDWGVYDFPNRVDVAPVGHRHILGRGNCWCGVRAERTAGRPMVIHETPNHDWQWHGADIVCERCGVGMSRKTEDQPCKGPSYIKSCRDKD
jgi:hypothetical protein